MSDEYPQTALPTYQRRANAADCEDVIAEMLRCWPHPVEIPVQPGTNHQTLRARLAAALTAFARPELDYRSTKFSVEQLRSLAHKWKISVLPTYLLLGERSKVSAHLQEHRPEKSVSARQKRLKTIQEVRDWIAGPPQKDDVIISTAIVAMKQMEELEKELPDLKAKLSPSNNDWILCNLNRTYSDVSAITKPTSYAEHE